MSIHRASHIVDPLADPKLASAEAAEAASAQRQLGSVQESCLFCTGSAEWAFFGALTARGVCSMCCQRSNAAPPLITEAMAFAAFERAQQLISS